MIWLILKLSVIGLIVGGLARLLHPGKEQLGLLGTVAVGIAGSYMGGAIGWLLTGNGDVFQRSGFLAAVVCSTVLCALYVRRDAIFTALRGLFNK